MMRAGSTAAAMMPKDQVARERLRSEELQRQAEETARRALAVTEKVKRVNRLYRERLTGTRSPE